MGFLFIQCPIIKFEPRFKPLSWPTTATARIITDSNWRNHQWQRRTDATATGRIRCPTRRRRDILRSSRTPMTTTRYGRPLWCRTSIRRRHSCTRATVAGGRTSRAASAGCSHHRRRRPSRRDYRRRVTELSWSWSTTAAIVAVGRVYARWVRHQPPHPSASALETRRSACARLPPCLAGTLWRLCGWCCFCCYCCWC